MRLVLNEQGDAFEPGRSLRTPHAQQRDGYLCPRGTAPASPACCGHHHSARRGTQRARLASSYIHRGGGPLVRLMGAAPCRQRPAAAARHSPSGRRMRTQAASSVGAHSRPELMNPSSCRPLPVPAGQAHMQRRRGHQGHDGCWARSNAAGCAPLRAASLPVPSTGGVRGPQAALCTGPRTHFCRL